VRFILALTLFVWLSPSAQDKNQDKATQPQPNPTNLKVLKVTTRPEVVQIMRTFTAGLGTQCNYCHVQPEGGPPDFASDANPKKEVARNMLLMAREINGKFPQDGVRRVSCYTCHRGAAKPLTAPPPEAPK